MNYLLTNDYHMTVQTYVGCINESETVCPLSALTKPFGLAEKVPLTAFWQSVEGL